MSSTDEKVTKDLIETLEDGTEGFSTGADKLRDIGEHDLASRFGAWSDQRAGFADELRELAAQYGDRIDESGSLAGALHRGWMAIKDAVTGDDAAAIVKAASGGEDHAMSEYDDALAADVSPHLHSVVRRQADEIAKVRSELASLAS